LPFNPCAFFVENIGCDHRGNDVKLKYVKRMFRQAQQTVIP